MKAIWVVAHGGPEVMKIQERPVPEVSAGQVLVKVHAVGVNPVDTYIRAGAYPNAKAPYTPGNDSAGVVEMVRAGVQGLKKGDRVYTSATLSGSYAEYALCEATAVHPLPSGISFNQGAALGIPYATAYRALFQKARSVAGETVLIHGASGGVGTAAVQLARAAGLVVIGTSGTADGRKLVGESGAHHVLDHGNPGYRDELMRVTSGRGVDVILEMLANVNLGADLGMLAKFGRVVVIGSRGSVEINPRDAMGRDATIMGMLLFNAAPQELQAVHAALFAGLEQGTLKPVVGKELPLEAAPQAHKEVLEPGAHGKIVLVP